MKWDDIPQLICDAQLNHWDLSIVDYDKFIDKQCLLYNLQMCPDFQRGHVWTETQQSKYIEFILRGGKTGRDFYFNQYGKVYVCVDGLQRTTAIQKFVNNQLKVFGQYFDEFGDPGLRFHTPCQNMITVYENNLSDYKDVLLWYIDMNEGGTAHTTEEIEKVKKMIKG